MAKNLVIVESPTKEKTISKFLGSAYVVRSSYGHIRDLPKSKIGVDIEHNFEPQYAVTVKAKKLIPELKKLSKAAAVVFLATDYDREGEAIAWHLKDALGLTDKKIRRITFHEITQEAIKEAIANPRDIDDALVNSQQARRVLDRLVGYKLSPLLWRKIKYGLSAGRVQSVAVRIICDREEEIEAFKPQEYWSLGIELEKKGYSPFTAYLHSKADKKYDKLSINEQVTVNQITSDIGTAGFSVLSIESKQKERSPSAPYTTSTLQQDASRRIYFSAAKTMLIAQKLYEGIDIGKDGNVGLITYMRTDSVNVAESFRKETAKYVEDKLGKKYLPAKPRIYKTKSKGAQEAHEAVRPTSVRRSPDELKPFLSDDEYKLYDLIWRRFVASQMANAVYDSCSADIKAKDYIFRATGRTLKFDGFLNVYEVKDVDDEAKEEKDIQLPPLVNGDALALLRFLPEQHFTEPPARYNEASIIKTLEEHGIGRPSTYAPTIHTIVGRGYVRLEQRRFYPTDLGKLVNDVLKNHFPDIVDLEFTANVEARLDDIAEGKIKWSDVVGDFYVPFDETLKKAETNLTRQKIKPLETDEKCPKCGKPMVIRVSRNGRFLACTGFPECKTTFSIDKDNNKIIKPAPEITSEVCEKCGKPMVKRFGRRGPFIACSGFPNCKNTKKIKAEDNSEPGKSSNQ